MRGTVNEAKMVGQGSNEKGPWIRYSVIIDGVQYAYFKEPGVVPGDLVEYETTVRGKYTNLTSLMKIELSKPEPSTTSTSYHSKSPDETAGIAKAVALKAALEWGSLVYQMNAKNDGMMSDEDLFREVEAVRDRWFSWLLTGKRQAAPTKRSDSVGKDEPPPDAYDQDAGRYVD